MRRRWCCLLAETRRLCITKSSLRWGEQSSKLVFLSCWMNTNLCMRIKFDRAAFFFHFAGLCACGCASLNGFVSLHGHRLACVFPCFALGCSSSMLCSSRQLVAWICWADVTLNRLFSTSFGERCGFFEAHFLQEVLYLYKKSTKTWTFGGWTWSGLQFRGFLLIKFEEEPSKATWKICVFFFLMWNVWKWCEIFTPVTFLLLEGKVQVVY